MAYRRGGRPGLDFRKKSGKDKSEPELGLENGRVPVKYRRRAEELFESMIADIHRRAEQRLEELDFMPREEEESVIEFDRAHRKLKNLDSHWEAARESKPHQEIDDEDLEQLGGIIREVEKSARLELKFACYLSLMLEEISETEVEPEDLEELEGDDGKEKRHAGEFVEEASRKAENDESRERDIIASEINRRLRQEEEQIKKDIREEEELVERYRRCLKLLEGIEKELEAIEDAKEEADTGPVRRDVRRSFGHVRITIAEREELADRIERAEGARKAISKAFFNGMLR